MTDDSERRALEDRLFGQTLDPLAHLEALRSHGHAAAIGTRYLGHGDDWLELGLDQRPDLVGDPATGVIASGPIIALLDMAMSLAAWLKRGEVVPQVTLDMRIDYMRPAGPDLPIVARGECYHLTHRISFVRGIAHDGDPANPVAHVVGTFIRIDEASR